MPSDDPVPRSEVSAGGQPGTRAPPGPLRRFAERQPAIARQRSLLEAAVSVALPAPFTSVASAADREGLG